MQGYFNKNQWEKSRQDGWIWLKLTAKPTRFRKSENAPLLVCTCDFVLY